MKVLKIQQLFQSVQIEKELTFFKVYKLSFTTRELLGTLVKCMGTHIKQPNNILLYIFLVFFTHFLIVHCPLVRGTEA